jgi:hypothetical protein
MNSFGDTDKEQIFLGEIFKDVPVSVESNELIAKKIKKDRENNHRVRNIVVIGAGASYDAYKGIPAGGYLAQELKEKFEIPLTEIDFLKNRFVEESRAIQGLTGKTELTFENYLYLLSKLFVTQNDLREKIKEMTGFRHSPHHFYEVIAHMLKHSFIDVVINFNFEEMLDQIINDEIGSDNYHYILSDGHVVKPDDLTVDGRMKIPIYIKPHGTYSHKSSLRFTNKSYLDLPEDIREMLITLISGQRGKGKPIQRINLITVGFALESMEFNDILNEYLPKNSVIYYITNPKPKISFKVNLFEAVLPKFTKRAMFAQNVITNDKINKQYIKYLLDDDDKKDDTDKYSKLDKKYNNVFKPIWNKGFNTDVGIDSNNNLLMPPLGEIASVLWRNTYSFFKESYRPRSVARHEITSYLFYDESLGKISDNPNTAERVGMRELMHKYYEKSPKYFRDRILVEIALAICRNNGIIDLIELLNGRTGLYYKYYVDACQKFPDRIRHQHSIFDLLNEFNEIGESPADEKDVYDVKEFLYSRNVFRIKVIDFLNINDSIDEKIKILNENWEEVTIEKVVNGKKKIINTQNKDGQNIIGEEFKNIIEIINSKPFGSPKKINDGKRKLFTNRALTVLYHLLASDKLSTKFKQNFLYNFNKKVFSGKDFENKHELQNEKQYEPENMMQDLFRLFIKSVGSHYYIIKSYPYSTKHFLWESYDKRKALHTNLALNYEIRDIFLRKEWDVMLCVSETGSTLGFLKEYEEHADKEADEDTVCKLVGQKATNNRKKDTFEELKDGKRMLILICSHEALRQYYENESGIELTQKQIIEEHKNKVCLENQIWDRNSIHILLMPYWEHNHHITMFLKSFDMKNNTIWKDFNVVWPVITPVYPKNKSDEDCEYGFISQGSIYIHRQGFSNSIDPLFIGTNHLETPHQYNYRDQSKLLLLFFTYICRAMSFEQICSDSNTQENHWQDIVFYDDEKQYIITKDQYKKWSPDELNKQLEVFMKKLYDRIRAKRCLIQ